MENIKVLYYALLLFLVIARLLIYLIFEKNKKVKINHAKENNENEEKIYCDNEKCYFVKTGTKDVTKKKIH